MYRPSPIKIVQTLKYDFKSVFLRKRRDTVFRPSSLNDKAIIEIPNWRR
jgi:hypothetical protein